MQDIMLIPPFVLNGGAVDIVVGAYLASYVTTPCALMLCTQATVPVAKIMPDKAVNTATAPSLSWLGGMLGFKTKLKKDSECGIPLLPVIFAGPLVCLRLGRNAHATSCKC